jgi:type I restriction enzyme S subunit
MSSVWLQMPLEACIESVRIPAKVPRSQFLVDGAYPVVSQEQGLVNGYWSQAADVFRVHRPVVVFGDHTRVLKYVDFDFVIGADGVKVLQTKQFLDPKYLYHFLQSIRIDGQGYARHFRLLKQVNVRFPESLDEQRRIVSILDEMSLGINVVITNTEKTLAKARELFDATLASLFGLDAAGVSESPLSELAEHITDGDHMPPPKAAVGIPFVTISNINKETRTIDFSTTFYVPQEYYDELKSFRQPKPRDILYTVTGSYGIPVIVDSDQKFCFQRHIAMIRPSSEVNARWLYYFLLSPGASTQARDLATGTAQKTVSLKSLRGFRVPRVARSEQDAAVKRLDAISDLLHRLDAVCKRRSTALAELKQSILHKAFAGELTAKEAERAMAAA